MREIAAVYITRKVCYCLCDRMCSRMKSKSGEYATYITQYASSFMTFRSGRELRNLPIINDTPIRNRIRQPYR